MQMMSGLVLIVGVILAGQMMAESFQVEGGTRGFPTEGVLSKDRQVMTSVLQKDGTLIAHPEPREQLNKDELIEKLKSIKRTISIDSSTPRGFGVGEVKENVAKQVVELMYKAKNKESTEVFKGVTVAKLLELNNFRSLASCSKENHRQRMRIIDEIFSKMGEGRDTPLGFAIDAYATTCLHLAAKHCIVHKDEVINQGINDENWMWRLQLNLPSAFPTGDF